MGKQRALKEANGKARKVHGLEDEGAHYCRYLLDEQKGGSCVLLWGSVHAVHFYFSRR